MMDNRRIDRTVTVFFISVLVFVSVWSSSYAYRSTTLCNGSRGEEVRRLQEALISLNYLKGSADGIFGNRTENAVRSFQKKNRLTVDGLAGEKTCELIFLLAGATTSSAPDPSELPHENPKPEKSTDTTASTINTGNIFGGNYTAIRYGNSGDRVRMLQNALISLGILGGKADGIFGDNTFSAVKKFQKSRKLTADGIAGKKTLSALEKAFREGTVSSPAPSDQSQTTTEPDSSESGLNERIKQPKISKLKLLHWFNDIKPSLSGGQKLLVYDPVSGLSWTLKVLARGRHCDAEPLTAKDTRTMVSAFNNINTWNQKAVYVKLPDGRWTVGSTHDMPHQSGNIGNNDFNGHLCVHFLRDMDETKRNDPNYGVANQETIRKFWKQLTGEDITY